MWKVWPHQTLNQDVPIIKIELAAPHTMYIGSPPKNIMRYFSYYFLLISYVQIRFVCAGIELYTYWVEGEQYGSDSPDVVDGGQYIQWEG